MKKINIVLAIIVVFIVVIVAGYFLYVKMLPQKVQAPQQPLQTNLTVGWNVLSNKEYGFSVKYPNNFFDPSQNPKILAGDCNYNVFPGQCPNINNIVINDMIAGGGDANAIKSNFSNPGYWDINGSKQTINNVQYCLYSTGDAATGHAFNYYYFATVKNKKCLVVYLSTVTANCDFYLPLEKGNTEQAKNYNNCLTTNKNQPIILNEIINTFKFSK